MFWITQTATAQRAALERGEISSLSLLEESIEQLENVAPFINPVSAKLYDRAREAALAADKLLARGKGGALCGIPVTVKDSQWLAGETCSHGSATLKSFVPGQTSQSIQRLEDAGAVVFAKTTCPEYCLSGITDSPLYGLTSNPWNLSRTSGGSSGGAAAAVAAGVGSLSLGGDGGGSIRIPSAFCGITGFKPSFGVVPRKPGFPTWESLVSYGPMTRSVADAELMYAVLSENLADKKNIIREDPAKFSVVVSEDLGFTPLDEDVRIAFRGVIHKLELAGIGVKYDTPGLTSSAVPWVVTATNDMFKHKDIGAEYSPEDAAELGIFAQEFIKFGAQFTDDDLSDVQQKRTHIYDAYVIMFERMQASILITPTLGTAAFGHGTTHPAKIGQTHISYPWLDWVGLLYDANLAGMPACSIPMGLNVEGMPLSMQILGLPGRDLAVLEAAEKIEQLLAWQQPSFRIEDISGGGYAVAPLAVHQAHMPGAEAMVIPENPLV